MFHTANSLVLISLYKLANFIINGRFRPFNYEQKLEALAGTGPSFHATDPVKVELEILRLRCVYIKVCSEWKHVSNGNKNNKMKYYF